MGKKTIWVKTQLDKLIVEYQRRYRIGEMWGYEETPPIWTGTVHELWRMMHNEPRPDHDITIAIYEVEQHDSH